MVTNPADIKDVGRDPVGRSEFWRELSWRCGDEHANRICKWINFYCWLYSLGHKKFWFKLPRS